MARGEAIIMTKPGLSRSQAGTAKLLEFTGAVTLLLFVVFFPACNLLSFYAACYAVQMLTAESAGNLAVSDSLVHAERKLVQCLKRYEDRRMTFFHQVQVRAQDTSLKVLLVNRSGPPQAIDLLQQVNGAATNRQNGTAAQTSNNRSLHLLAALPRSKRPAMPENRNKLYVYRLQVNCTVEPFFNLSFIPIVGQIPIIGCSQQIVQTADALIENPDSLN